MKLSRLLELLDRYPRDAEVRFATDSKESLEVLSVYEADGDNVIWIDVAPEEYGLTDTRFALPKKKKMPQS